MGGFLLIFLVLFPMAGAVAGYLTGRKNKSARDWLVLAVTVVELLGALLLLYFPGRHPASGRDLRPGAYFSGGRIPDGYGAFDRGGLDDDHAAVPILFCPRAQSESILSVFAAGAGSHHGHFPVRGFVYDLYLF